jgi:hypothetical protein
LRTFLALLFLALPLPAQSAWELNELSYLFPLPEPLAENHLWGTSTPGRHGTLLPRSVYAELPMLVVPRDREWLYENLRVVAARIDPCFREGHDESAPCRRQIRFVWQPMEIVRGSWTTLDAAVHTFHELSEDEWKKLRLGLFALKTKFPMDSSLPLQVHPLLSRSPQGTQFRELSRLLHSFTGPANLVRATAMTVNTQGTVWVFTGFDIKDGVATRIPVPRTKNVAQAFFTSLENPFEYKSTMNPFPANESPFLRILQDSAAAEREMKEEELVEGVRSAINALNPLRSNPGTIDCASCHAARAVPTWAKAKFNGWNWEGLFGKDLFRSSANLADTTPQPRRTNLLRAFGYFGSDPVISPRTVFETALASAKMED